MYSGPPEISKMESFTIIEVYYCCTSSILNVCGSPGYDSDSETPENSPQFRQVINA